MTEVNENRLRSLETTVQRLEIATEIIKSHLISELGGNGTPGNLRRIITDTNDDVKALGRKLERFIDGNGVDGARVRLDRLDQFRKAGIWFFSLLTTVVVGLVAKEVIGR